ncbi:hypothetical protein SEA_PHRAPPUCCINO_184 [Mycobacterium phage Phrappuccino]|uniref:Uncharacterized protein n=1 Tax=Mycobacterium phage Phrappuccino TaxID=2591223 RepID=A0A514DE20_9CAUD|nr:hypothetical protein KHQ87_gp184 [Mycobacterium phage Phrappuccino]QDH91859.1 hypothetical protein SEA_PHRAPPUCCINO_184 [Mycobacterium phage Phrappuccino]
MTTSLSEKVAKLLNQAERAGTEAEARANALANQVGLTHIWHGDYKAPIYVPSQHRRVHFDLGAPGEHYTEIQVGFTADGRLEIQGGHELSVDMQSSNTFQVRFKEQR